jgi:uncharacterized coiled-coil DUF342 family protein
MTDQNSDKYPHSHAGSPSNPNHSRDVVDTLKKLRKQLDDIEKSYNKQNSTASNNPFTEESKTIEFPHS